MLTAITTAIVLASLACVALNIIDMIDDARRDARRRRSYIVHPSMRDSRPVVRRPATGR